MNLEDFENIYDIKTDNIREEFNENKNLEYYYNLLNKNIEKLEVNNSVNNIIFLYFDEKPHFKILLYLVIKNFKDWSHTVICNNKNYDVIKNMCNEISVNINIIKVDISKYCLLDENIWNKIESKNNLIIDENLFFMKNIDEEYLNYNIINNRYMILIKTEVIKNILKIIKFKNVRNSNNDIYFFSKFLERVILKMKIKNVYIPEEENNYCSINYNNECFCYYNIWNNNNYLNIINNKFEKNKVVETVDIILISGILDEEIYNKFEVYDNIDNLEFKEDRNYLFINGDFDLDVEKIKELEIQLEKSYCYVMSPLIVCNDILEYYGGIINEDDYNYVNEKLLKLEDINNNFWCLYNQGTMIPYLTFFMIKNKENVLCGIDIKNYMEEIISICIKLKEIKVSPFVRIESYDREYKRNINIRYKNEYPFIMDNEKISEIYKMYNKNELVSLKLCDEKYYLNLSNRKTILIVEYYKFTPDKDCGSLYIYYLMKTLLNMGFNIHFYNILSDGKYNKILQEMGVYVFDKNLKMKNIINNNNVYEYIFISRVFSMNYLFEDIKKYCSRTKIIFITHDIYLLKNKKQLNLGMNIANNPKGEDELKYINNCDMSLIVSKYEYEYLKNEENLEKIHYSPICYEMENDYDRKIEDTKDIYFIGSGYNANVDALRHFLKNQWDFIVERLGNIKLHIIGFGLTNLKVEYKKNPTIVFHGYVPDEKLNDIIIKCRLNIVPLRYGGGIKGKILQSLNLKIPCIATKVAVEGMELIDREHIIVEYLDNTFPEKFEKYYNNIELLKKISDNGYKIMKEKYSLEKNVEYLNDMFNNIKN